MVRIKDDTIPERIKECLTVFERQGNWNSINIAKSLLRQHAQKGELSTKQTAMVEIWERDYTLPDDNWKDEYSASEQERKLFEKAVSYFDSTNSLYYYRQRIAYCKDREGYIPTRRDFNRMTQNKYFVRWLEASDAEPKFSLGDLVESRQGSGSRWNLRGLQFVITKVMDEVDPCKGGRWYAGYSITGEVKYGNRLFESRRFTKFREKEVKTFRK